MEKEYRWICRRLKSRVKAAVARHELELANDKKNPKRLFYYINRKKRLDLDIKEIKDKDGKHISDGNGICNILNEYFKSIFVSKEPEMEPESASVGGIRIDYKMPESVKVLETEVRDVLCGLEKTKAPGADGISPFVLNEMASEFSGPLCVIFNLSLSSGKVPSQCNSVV